MEVLMKVCKALECNIGDIMDLIPEEGKEKWRAVTTTN